MALIAFDLDGTLVDQAAAARRWAVEFVAEWRLGGHEIERIARSLSARGPKDDVFADLARTWSLPVPSAHIWDQYRARMPDLVRCAEPDLQALRVLRETGWTIGIVTNGMADNQEGKIRRTGLADLVYGWVISSEVGYRKPDPEIFRALASRLDCSLQGWMVSDSLQMDVAGGAAVGWRRRGSRTRHHQLHPPSRRRSPRRPLLTPWTRSSAGGCGGRDYRKVAWIRRVAGHLEPGE